MNYTFTVGRGGHNPEAQSEIILAPFTKEEMKEYNETTGSEYELLPPEYYTLPTQLTLAPNELYKNVDVVFKSAIGTLTEGKDYLLPIRLLTNSGSVNENKNLLCLKPNVLTPSVLLREPVNGKLDVTMSTEDAETEKTVEVRYYLDLKNEWNFSVNFEKDVAQLTAAVNAYNEKNDSNYPLLPIANYEFDASLSFTQAASNPKLPVKLDRNGLEVGSYLLPIIPTDCAGMPFDISKAICYIHVMITEQLPQIDLKNKATLKASSTVQWSGEEIKNVLDNNPETHWQSIWCDWPSGSTAGAFHDPTYGVYIDITLNDALSKQISLDYTTRKSDGNAVPNHIVIYAGTSVSNLQKVGELKRIEDGLPTTGNTQYSSKNFSLKSETTLLRLAILSQYKASDKSIGSLTEVNFKSVVISELSLYDK